MNIAVSGAAGFVGQHLVKELYSTGHNVTALVRAPFNFYEDLDEIVIDFNNADSLRDSVEFDKFDAIVHLAGHAAVGASFANPTKYETENPGMQDNLVNACIDQNATPRLLVASTGSVYDASTVLPLTEESPIKANSPYAKSKILQESRVEHYRQLGFDCDIARPFNHTGPGQKPGFICADFAHDLVKIESGVIDSIKVGNLDAKRDYTDVRDIVRAYRSIIEQESRNTTYNICSGVSLSGHELLGMFVAKSLVAVSVTEDPARMRPSDAPEIVGSYGKLNQATGWTPQIPIGQTLDDMLTELRSKNTSSV